MIVKPEPVISWHKHAFPFAGEAATGFKHIPFNKLPETPSFLLPPLKKPSSGKTPTGGNAPTGTKTDCDTCGDNSNPLPENLARVMDNNGNTRNTKMLGIKSHDDVFVTDADAIRGLNSSELANRLTIPESENGYIVIEFPRGDLPVASPIRRANPGFIEGGRTVGGAPEYVIPNGPIPSGSTIRDIQ